MSFHYDILPDPKDRFEGILFSGALQARMQTYIGAISRGEEMTPEEEDAADRFCYACAGVDYGRRQEADDWRICMKLMRIVEGGKAGREAMEMLKSSFDELTEEDLRAAMKRFQEKG